MFPKERSQAIDKYRNEPKFHMVVESMKATLVKEFISSSDMRMAVDLAIDEYYSYKRKKE